MNRQSASRRVISWFKDDVFRRLLVNAGWLLSANSIAALLGFGAAFFAARGLQPAGYGSLALVVAYVNIVGKSVSFQAWQAIIKFGSDALMTQERDKFHRLVKFGFILDAGSAIIGFVLAIAASSYLIGWLGWEPSLRTAIMVYSWLILVNLGGTPIGLLRLFNRFDLLSYNRVATAALQSIGVLWCWLTEQSLMGYVWIYLVAGVLGQLCLLWMTLYQLRRHQFGGFLFTSLQGIRTDFPGILNYVWTTNLHATVKLLSRELDLVIVAAFVSPAGVGIYKLAKQFAKALATFSDPLYQSVFPELAQLWSRQRPDKFVSLMKRTTLFVGAGALLGWLGFLAVGYWLIVWLVGPEYEQAYMVALIYMLGTVIALLTFSFTPALLAMGLPVKTFLANLIATFFYFAVLIPFLLFMGIIGAALAHVVFYLVWSAVMLYVLLPRLKEAKMNVQ
jgi:O-antigen/teichoic acid export membrane protein